MWCRSRRSPWSVLALVAALGCVGDGTGLDPNGDPVGSGPPPGGVSFADDIQPIFTANCTFSNCHDAVDPQLGQSLAPGRAYASIVNVRSVEAPALDRVEPGDPAASYLVHKIEGTQGSVGGFGGRMPLGGGALPGAEIQLIRAWVEAGAPNN